MSANSEKYRTIKIKASTLQPLRVLAATTGETMMNCIDRLVREEQQRKERTMNTLTTNETLYIYDDDRFGPHMFIDTAGGFLDMLRTSFGVGSDAVLVQNDGIWVREGDHHEQIAQTLADYIAENSERGEWAGEPGNSTHVSDWIEEGRENIRTDLTSADAGWQLDELIAEWDAE